MSESDDRSPGSRAGSDDAQEYRCRKCPGLSFTANELDGHREYHRQEREKAKKAKGRTGPRSRKSGRDRSPSPAITLFEQIGRARVQAESSQTGRRSSRRTTPVTVEISDNRPKKKSKKNYDDTIIGSWSNGTGA